MALAGLAATPVKSATPASTVRSRRMYALLPWDGSAAVPATMTTPGTESNPRSRVATGQVKIAADHRPPLRTALRQPPPGPSTVFRVRRIERPRRNQAVKGIVLA